jgi:hypothetical protein
VSKNNTKQTYTSSDDFEKNIDVRLNKLEKEINEMILFWNYSHLLANSEKNFKYFIKNKCTNHQYNYEWESTIH